MQLNLETWKAASKIVLSHRGILLDSLGCIVCDSFVVSVETHTVLYILYINIYKQLYSLVNMAQPEMY